MAIWEAATLAGKAPGDRVDVEDGTDWVRILSPSFRLNDGNDYSYVSWGNKVIAGDEA